LLNVSLVRRALLVFAVVATAIFLSIANGAGKAGQQPVSLDGTTSAAEIRIEYGKSGLTITGDSSSVAHEAILRQTALNLFPHTKHEFELRQRRVMPPGWALLTELTLRAVAQTYSSTATIDATKVAVRGITMRKTEWDEAAARLTKHLPEGTVLQQEIIELRPGATLESQCSALFRSALQARRIEFPRDSDQLSSNAYSVLDELIQIIADCPAAIIAITGHTDASGNESNNQRLSEARANSVMAYMIAGGISADRLQAFGAGSAMPLLNEDNAHARHINRRIEIQISFR
jgi:outer membrane protein OmpA-like peptidoglycan-associated protein